MNFDQKRLRKNVNNELQNLSFRNLAALLIVNDLINDVFGKRHRASE